MYIHAHMQILCVYMYTRIHRHICEIVFDSGASSGCIALGHSLYSKERLRHLRRTYSFVVNCLEAWDLPVCAVFLDESRSQTEIVHIMEVRGHHVCPAIQSHPCFLPWSATPDANSLQTKNVSSSFLTDSGGPHGSLLKKCSKPPNGMQWELNANTLKACTSRELCKCCIHLCRHACTSAHVMYTCMHMAFLNLVGR